MLGGLEVLRMVQGALIENYAVHKYNRTLKLFTVNIKTEIIYTIYYKCLARRLGFRGPVVLSKWGGCSIWR